MELGWGDHAYTHPQSTDTEVTLIDPKIEQFDEPTENTEPTIKIEIESEDEKDPLIETLFVKQEEEDEEQNDQESIKTEPPKNLQCTFCSQKFKYYWAFKMHLSKVHATEDIDEAQCKCPFCPKTFKNQQMLAFHIEIEQAHSKNLSNKVLIKCSRCDAKYNGFYRLTRHLSAVHGITGIKAEEIFPNGYPYECPDCTSSFTDPHILKNHRRKVHKYWTHATQQKDTSIEKNYICDFCAKRFANKFILLKHLKWFHLSVGRTGLNKFRCKSCFAMFSFATARDDHEKSCHTFKQCCECQRKFASTDTLMKHFALKHPKPKEPVVTNKKRKFGCPLCLKKFLKQKHLISHFEVKDYQEPIPKRRANFCDDCGELITTTIAEHKKKVHRPNVDKIHCKVVSCGAIFGWKEHLEDHMRKKHGENAATKPFVCHFGDTCEAAYTSFKALASHVKKEHNTEVTLEDVCPNGQKPYQCPHCEQSYAAPNELNTHMKKQNCIKEFKCCKCQEIFKNSLELRTHFDSSHEVPKAPTSLSKKHKYECIYCLQWFRTQTSYKKHFDDVNFKEKLKKYYNHACRECDKVFDASTTLQAHIGSAHNHAQQYDFVCECGKAFGSNLALQRHTRKSHPSEPLKCKCCQREDFTSKEGLRRHLVKYHPNGKLLTCKICSLELETFDSYTSHSYSHCTYQCTICGKGYNDRKSFKIHLAEHEGIVKTFLCSSCNLEFKSRGGLKNHQKTCFGEDEEMMVEMLNSDENTTIE